MKKYLFICACMCFIANLRAQEDGQPTKIDSMLVNIDKTTFTSGILYDRIVPFARLRAFNDSTNVSRTEHFEQALQELYSASNKEKFLSYKSFRERYTSESLSNETDIGVLNASFHSLNYIPDNPEQGALHVVDGLFEKIDNEKPPFLPQHVLVVSPTKRYLKADIGQPIIFNFTGEFLIQGTEGKNIVRLTANFDTVNNYVLIEEGNVIEQHIPINYSEEGWKKLSFIAAFEDDSEITVFADAYVGFFTSTYTKPTPVCAEDELAFQGYDFDPDETYPIKGCIEYRVYYRNGGNELMKPVIIIDGFDPGDKRRIKDADSKLPPDDHDSMEEFMVYFKEGNPEPIKLIPLLNTLGYDVVMVNQPTYKVNENQPSERTIDGGADYIERNARAHIVLYQELNNQLAINNSTEKLVIVGPSMGGQISRYALAYMEEHDMDHNTRLWISVDSPHLGANIPLGLQSLLNQVANAGETRAIDFVENQLGSVAAKQQLIEQYKVETINAGGFTFESNIISPDLLNGRTTGQGFSQNRGSDFFVTYYNDLYSNGLQNSRGYPQDVRRIALVNGSLAGSDEFFNTFVEPAQMDNYIGDSETGVNIRGFQKILWFDEHIASLEADNMPTYGQYSKVSRFKKAFNDNSKYVTNINSRGNMDNIPGGWFPSFNIMIGDLDGNDAIPSNGSFWSGSWADNILHTVSNWLGGAELDVRINEHVNSFIPTVSALGFIDPDFSWYEGFDRNLICPPNPEIPFHNYYGPEINERHTSFTEESVDWLLDELDGDTNYPAPTVYLDGGDISGPEHLCYGEEGVYSIDACVEVESWQVSNNLQIISSINQSVTVKFINYTANWGAYIQANLPHDVAKRHIQVGTPDVINTQMTADAPPYTVNWRTMFRMEESGNDVEYHWSINFIGSMAGPNGCTSGTARFLANNSTTFVYTPINNNFTNTGVLIEWGSCEATYEIKCEVRNKCGLAGTGVMRVNTELRPGQNPCDPPKILAQITPNPNSGNEDWHVVIEKYPCPPENGGGDNPNPPGGPTPPIIVKIFDIFARERYSNQFETTEFAINGLYLEPGQYIVNILSEEGMRGQEIIIVE